MFNMMNYFIKTNISHFLHKREALEKVQLHYILRSRPLKQLLTNNTVSFLKKRKMCSLIIHRSYRTLNSSVMHYNLFYLSPQNVQLAGSQQLLTQAVLPSNRCVDRGLTLRDVWKSTNNLKACCSSICPSEMVGFLNGQIMLRHNPHWSVN